MLAESLVYGESPGLPAPVRALVYKAQQRSILAVAGIAQRTARAVLRQEQRVDSEVDAIFRRRYRELLQRDLGNVAAGYYPASLLRFPAWRHAKNLPRLVADIPRTVRRIAAQNHQDFASDVDLASYPAYYRRNFHWQTGGYLSGHSAAIYDLGVELIFVGTADIMRRQVIPPVADHLANKRGAVLDIACGTGSVLSQMMTALPDVNFTGIDLSPNYIEHARDRLNRRDGSIDLHAGNAEHMPFADDSFDAITCVYLFHELPKDARRNVMTEALRILRPGGVFIIQDSIQETDSSAVAQAMENFSQMWHEPYYKGYTADDLGTALNKCGFEVTDEEPCFAAKIVTCRKPGR